jgi:hypothetical protein
MKWIVIVVCGVMLVGCATKQYRTGSVCVTPAVTAGFETSNPIDVKQDIADAIGNKIRPEFKSQIEYYTKMTFVEDCKSADFAINSNLKTIETSVTDSRQIVPFISNTGVSSRTFGVGLGGSFVDNKSKASLAAFDEYAYKSDLSTSITYAVYDAIKKVRYLPAQ